MENVGYSAVAVGSLVLTLGLGGWLWWQEWARYFCVGVRVDPETRTIIYRGERHQLTPTTEVHIRAGGLQVLGDDWGFTVWCPKSPKRIVRFSRLVRAAIPAAQT